MGMGAVLYVCTTCRAGQPVPEGAAAPGMQLFDALTGAGAPEGVTIRPVECLSACDHGCSVALSKTGGWSYVYGRMTLADADNGIVPWRDRPVIFRKQSLARIPPMEP